MSPLVQTFLPTEECLSLFSFSRHGLDHGLTSVFLSICLYLQSARIPSLSPQVTPSCDCKHFVFIRAKDLLAWPLDGSGKGTGLWQDLRISRVRSFSGSKDPGLFHVALSGSQASVSLSVTCGSNSLSWLVTLLRSKGWVGCGIGATETGNIWWEEAKPFSREPTRLSSEVPVAPGHLVLPGTTQ